MISEGKPRVVVLLSGGMDSCVCAALAARDGDAAAVHISYGQRTEARERQSFLAVCERLGIPNRLIVRNEALRAIGGSALTARGRCTLAPWNRTVPGIRIAGQRIMKRSTGW